MKIRVIVQPMMYVILLVSTIGGYNASAQNNFNAELVGTYKFGYLIDALELDGDILYIANYDWIISADVSDPESPVFLDTLGWYGNVSTNDYCTGLVVNDNTLYGISTMHGLLTIDVSDPSDMSVVAATPLASRTQRMQNMYGYGNYVMPLTLDSMLVYDVSNPIQPFATSGCYARYYGIPGYHGAAMCIYDSTLFISDWPSGFEIRPARLDSNGALDFYQHTYKFKYAMLGALAASDSLLFVGGALLPDGYFCDVYSYSSEFEFTHLARIDVNPFNLITWIVVHENYLFLCSNSGQFISVYDLSNPSNPIKLAYYQPFESVGNFTRMSIHGNYVILGSSEGYIVVIKINIPMNNENTPPAPSSLSLAPAYPNPVASGSAATVEFALPASGHVTLTLCNTLGQELRRTEKRMEPGTHTERISTTGLNPGVYYYTLTAEGKRETEMLVVGR